MTPEIRAANLRAHRLGKALAKGMSLFVLAILAGILAFLFWQGARHLDGTFLFAHPENLGRAGGIFPIIVSTALLCLVALAIAVPLGLGTAVFLTEYTKEGWLTTVIRFGTECLAGIPSIIFGLFGFMLFVVKMGLGWSILSGGLTLACMVLPTIIRTSEEAIKTVPDGLRELAYSLGATRSEMIVRVVLPAAKNGILTGVILALGRVIGETACVIFTTGISMEMPTSLFDSARSMSVHFYILAREGISLEMAYTTALTLIILIMLINTAANLLMRKA